MTADNSASIYPADIIAGAEVFKSGASYLQGGGIGATINLTTAKPLSVGDKLIVTTKGHFEHGNRSTTPEIYRLISHKFADGQLGGLLSASYQKRRPQADYMRENGWNQFDATTLSAADPLANLVNPANVTTGILARENQTAVRFDQGNQGAYQTLVYLDDRRTQVKNAGFNARWTPTSKTEASLDYSHSNSAATPGFGNGQASVGRRSTFSGKFTGQYPQVTLPVTQAVILDPTNYNAHVAIYGVGGIGDSNSTVDDTINEFKADFKWKPDGDGAWKGVRADADYLDEAGLGRCAPSRCWWRSVFAPMVFGKSSGDQAKNARGRSFPRFTFGI